MATHETPPAPISIQHLRTEYLENPLGIDARRLRLEWRIEADARGVVQSAYQVQVADALNNLTQGENLLWDTGKVTSDAAFVRCTGVEMRPRRRYFWRVRVWDEQDRASAWSEPAWWEMGLLDPKEWTAEWIEVGWDEDPEAFKPCPFFRRAFRLDAPARSARLYITAHGIYEAWLNGQRVGDQCFTPGFTPYHKMLQYQVYDVTALMQEGDNALGAILGDGWHRGKVHIAGHRNVYGDRLALLAMLVVETAQGTQLVIGTDSAWKATTGPILKSDLKDGEIYDARLEMPGWCAPDFDDRGWQGVRVVSHPKQPLVASMGPPVRRKETFTPTVLPTPKGETVLDFGQNLAGVVHFKVKGPEGAVVRLTHGEALDKDGNFTLAHLLLFGKPDPEKNPFQQVQYILKGEGVEEYEPRFTVHGFRYVKVEGWPGAINPDDFYSVAIYSDMEPTGSFECSDPLINRLHKNVEWSMKGNFLDLPTDCPQRERAGWTGDAQIFAPSAAFLMDVRAFFRKWLKELTLEQYSNGMVGNFVPNPEQLVKKPFPMNFLTKLEGSAGWGDAATIIPWALYQAYGDLEFLENQYENMKAWVEYMRKRATHANRSKYLNPRYLFNKERRKRQHLIWDTNYHWGEWLEPGESGGLNTFLGILKRFYLGEPVVATAYFAYSTHLLAKAAEALGKSEDAAFYGSLADQIKAAYAAEFIGKDGRIHPDRQASYVRVLAFDLAPEELKPAIVEHLVRLVRTSGNHVGTGFLSTVFLCEVLAENGRLDVAYDLLTQKTAPSWLYAVTKGATTIWEAWEGIDAEGEPHASLNHYSPGAVVNFLHCKVAGIEAAAPGYKRIRIHPMPGDGLTGARASYDSVHGRIVSDWQIDGDRLRLHIAIPANTSAEVTLPGASLAEVTESGAPFAEATGVSHPTQRGADLWLTVGSGRYTFEYPLRR
ncbi:MAG: alpha-L-rhamnosidase [Chloroflexota bacterium]|nr:MAG: alpha-L-rhamnosidase [Chloroflexota bacterium]